MANDTTETSSNLRLIGIIAAALAGVVLVIILIVQSVRRAPGEPSFLTVLNNVAHAISENHPKKNVSPNPPAQPGVKTKTPIVGAFGLKLNELLTPGRPVSTSDGWLQYQFTPAVVLPGYDTYWVYLTALTHRVGAIEAATQHADAALVNRTLAAFSTKYGATPARSVTTNGTATYRWVDGPKDITLTSKGAYASLCCNDRTYDSTAVTELASGRAPAIPNLSGLFGVQLGAVLHAPVGAQKTAGGVSFNVAAAQPTRGLDHYRVSVTPHENRICSINGSRDQMPSSDLQHLLAELTAKHGPATLEVTLGGNTHYRTWRYHGSSSLFLIRHDSGQVELKAVDSVLNAKAQAEAK